MEWWLANGIGGYAAGTVAGTLTRRYHGLLIAPLDAPLGRRLILSRADATLQLDGQSIPLHSNSWHDGEVNPQGYRQLQRFYLDGNLPVWQFTVGSLTIEQRIWMTHGKNQTCVAYRLLDDQRDQAEVTPLTINLTVNDRDHHHVTHDRHLNLTLSAMDNLLTLDFPHQRQFYLRFDAERFDRQHTWFENFHLAEEQARGLEAHDNHLCIGQLLIHLTHDWQGFVFSDDAGESRSLATLYQAEQQRLADLQQLALPGRDSTQTPDWIAQLVMAADSFVIRRPAGTGEPLDSIIAGYPWFGDWGRDTMIALPGLCLACGRQQTALNILQSFSRFIRNGLLPNYFPGAGQQPAYNTVDAALWYIEAWRAYFAATHDLDAIAGILPVLEQIIDAYRNGTDYGIGMDDSDALIRAGIAGQQLTWMDARANGREVTPRIGKPVEINALWYNAINSLSAFRHSLGLPHERLDQLAERVASGFQRFVRDDGYGLADVLDVPNSNDDHDNNDYSIRPNQVFALSLTYSALTSMLQRQAVLNVCHEQLLTDSGLRSLAAADERYVGRYEGGVARRDGSYHQGTVWAWLSGHFAMASYRVNGDAALALQLLEKFRTHLGEAGLGQISEIFDGDYPHEPRGAPAQAWSVACLLDSWWKLADKT